MENVKAFIDSGIIEQYVMGIANDEEMLRVLEMAQLYPEIKKEIQNVEKSLQAYATSIAKAPHPALKPLLLATIEYTERLENGEKPTYPPIIYEHSKTIDYKEWLDRPDMRAPEDFDEIHVKLIGATPEVTSAIVWIKNMAPQEVHDHEYEKFLIVEGSCDITIGDAVHKLKAGDNLTIPLHVTHHVTVTSSIPCKVILQRVAA